MKIHEMKLSEESFEKIKNKQKDIEVRLFDDKRKLIQLHDIIRFKKLPSLNEETLAKVTGLSKFSNFKDLFINFSNNRFGHHNLTLQDQITKVYKIYDKESEKNNGVVGIHLKKI